MSAWRRKASTALDEGVSMVELGFVLLGVGFSVAVAQLFVGRPGHLL